MFTPILDDQPFAAPVGKILCIGRNYAAHAAELNNPLPDQAVLFIKPADAACDMAQAIVVPADQGSVHHELEIALLIGSVLKNATPDALKTQLEDLKWRRLFGDVIAEGLGLLRAAGLKPKPATGKVPPSLIPHVMRLPNPLFQMIAGAMVRIDPNARSSMWEDLKLGRPTEIDALQGAILRLAERLGRRAPIAERVMEEIRKAEAAGAGSPGLSPDVLRA